MADLEAAIGYVVAHGDAVDRARLSWLCAGVAPPDDIIDKAETGQARKGGWHGAAVRYYLGWFYEAAQIQVILAERVADMSAADCALMMSALRRVGMKRDDWLLVSAARRLSETQRGDGGWPSDDGDAFNVH